MHAGHANHQLLCFKSRCFLSWIPSKFPLGVEPFDADKMAPLTNINMAKNTIEMQKMASPKTFLKLTQHKVRGTHMTGSMLVTKYPIDLKPQSHF